VLKNAHGPWVIVERTKVIGNALFSLNIYSGQILNKVLKVQ
jgi:hypothetical protein